MFFRGPSLVSRLIGFALLSLSLMVVDQRANHLNAVRSALDVVIYPLQLAVSFPFEAFDWLHEQLTSRQDLIASNQRLRQQKLILQGRLERYDQLMAENERLRKLLESSARIPDQVLVAELLAVDLAPFSRRIVINRGLKDGVVEGQSLLDANGVMGQVIHAGPMSSTALLITDASHALPVQVNRTGFRAVAVGTGVSDHLELTHVTNDVDVQVGDTVVTSGLGGRFPAGYPVGRVVNVRRNRGESFAVVEVRPSARLERNREVLLVAPTERTRILDSALRPSG